MEGETLEGDKQALCEPKEQHVQRQRSLEGALLVAFLMLLAEKGSP